MQDQHNSKSPVTISLRVRQPWRDWGSAQQQVEGSSSPCLGTRNEDGRSVGNGSGTCCASAAVCSSPQQGIYCESATRGNETCYGFSSFDSCGATWNGNGTWNGNETEIDCGSCPGIGSCFGLENVTLNESGCSKEEKKSVVAKLCIYTCLPCFSKV